MRSSLEVTFFVPTRFRATLRECSSAAVLLRCRAAARLCAARRLGGPATRRYGEKNLRSAATWQQGEKNLPLEPRDDLRREALGNRDGDLGRRLDVI